MEFIETDITSTPRPRMPKEDLNDVLRDMRARQEGMASKPPKAAKRKDPFKEKRDAVAKWEEGPSKEAKLEVYEEAKAIIAKLEADPELDLIQFPTWNKPVSWQMMPGAELQPGDGVQYNSIICIVAKKLGWWRSKTANILIHEHHNPAKYYRIGEIDYVLGYPGYVAAQRLSKFGDDLFS